MTARERQDLIESVAFAVDIVRDAMTTTEARLGRGAELYRALREFEAAGLYVRAVALATPGARPVALLA